MVQAAWHGNGNGKCDILNTEQMETPRKKEAKKDQHKPIQLPERMERNKEKPVRSAQSTVGVKTPGKVGKQGMTEAAERKARREGRPEPEPMKPAPGKGRQS